MLDNFFSALGTTGRTCLKSTPKNINLLPNGLGICVISLRSISTALSAFAGIIDAPSHMKIVVCLSISSLTFCLFMLHVESGNKGIGI